METIISAQKFILTDRNVDTLERENIWFASLAYPTEARFEMIRQHYLTQINDIIVEQAEGRFKEADFSVLLRNEETEHVLEITYRYEPKYMFVAKMPLSDGAIQGDVYFFVTVSPGDMFITEAAKYVKPKDLDDYIKAWLQRLDDELSSVPIQRQLEEQQREIDQIFEQLGNIPTDYFSRQEAEILKNRLDDLEVRLTQNLQETIEDQTELQTKVDEIASEMSVLKENVNLLNKRGWAKALVTRTFEWAKDPANRKLLKSGAEVAKELLLPGDINPPKL